MATTLTGRSRAADAAGSFSGTSQITAVYKRLVSGVYIPVAPYWDHNLLQIDISFLGAMIRFRTLEAVSGPTAATRTLQLECWTGPGLGVGDGDTDQITEDLSSTGEPTEDWTVLLSGGSWSISCTGLEETLDDAGGDYPTYGGAKVSDPPGERNAQYRDRLQEGKEIIITASVGGMSVSASVTIDAARVQYITEYDLAVQVIAEGRGAPCTEVGIGSAALSIGGIPAILTGNFSGSDALHAASASSETGKVQAFCDADARKTIINAVLYPRRDALINFGVRAMEDAYPGSVNLRMDKKATQMASIQSVSDGGTYSIQQARHALSGSFWQRAGGGHYTLDHIGDDTPNAASGLRPTSPAPVQPTGVNLNEKTPLRMWLDADWIINQGEQPDDWRFLLHGLPYDSFTLIQASEMVVTSTLTSETGPTDLTISLPDATTAAELQGSSFTGASLRGYRYLRLRMKADSSETVTVKIGAKEWELNLTTSYQNFDIDLCRPKNAAVDSDAFDTFFPMPTDDDHVNADGVYWGVSAAASIVVQDIAGGVTVDVESAKLVRDSYSRATFLQPFPMEWIAAGDTSEYPVRMIDGDTDGRRSLEGIHFYRTGISYFSRSLTSIIGSINGAGGTLPSDGFTATAAGSFPDSYHDNDLDSCFAWGGGMLYSGSGWTYGFDQSVNTSLSVKAQPLWDSVDWLPCWGDGFFYIDGDYEQTGVFAAGKILRGQAVGLVSDQDGEPAEGVTVSVDGGASGSGTTGSNGAYQTGLPYPKGGTTKSVSVDQGEPPVSPLSILFPARKRKRACFSIVETTTEGICLVVDSPRGWLHIGVDNRIRTYHVNYLSLLMESDEYPDVDTFKKLRVDNRWARLYMMGLEGADTWRVYVSEDGGLTGTEVLSVTADSAALAVDSERGIVTFLYEAGAGVFAVQSEDGGDTWSSAEEVEYDGGQLDATLLDAAHDPRTNGAIFLAVSDGSNASVLKSETIAADFFLVLS